MKERPFPALLAAVMISACGSGEESSQKGIVSHTANQTTYVKNETCVECHPKQYKEWTRSHHDLAMDVATEETVIGDFNNSTFTQHGVTSTFYKKDGKFFVRTDGRNGKLHDYEITYVFGVDPLQQYMIEFPDGRIQLPDIGWDNHSKEEGGQRWVHLHPDEDISPRHIFHWTRRFLNWNYMCAECHTTNLQKNFDLETNTFKTTWSDIDVGCQACHGPGSNHVEWARSIEKTGNKEHKYDNRGLEVDLKAEDSRVQIEACARCHSRRNGLRVDYQYGKPFMDYFVPQVLTDPLYYPDGQILDEVYVYGSFIQSKKYQQGIRCTDCHHPHSARLFVDGNVLCTRCHSPAPKQRFETVAPKNYDSPDHHFHKQDSPGAQCVECHMPETKYMIVDPRRDHSFQIPRPDISVKLNVPNSCNRCHKDQSARWAADKVNEWYPSTRDKREKETYFAEIFAAGQAGKAEAEAGLVKVARDQSQPAIIRATALNILSAYRSQDALDITASSLNDDDPLVRYEAVRGISALIHKRLGANDQQKKYSTLVPLLKDPIHAVRTEAARALTEVPKELFNQLHRKDFEKVLDEYKERQQAIADRPESHLNLGLMYENVGEKDKAETSYKTAMRLVPDFLPARFNLANLYNLMGRNADAERVLRDGFQRVPNEGQLYYSLGLLLAEEKRYPEVANNLGKAAELMPKNARAHYNHGLALQHLGRRSGAETALLKAHRLGRSDPSILQALAVFYFQGRQWDQATIYAEQLARLYPNERGPSQMLEQINKARGTQ
jgi:Flp pilus assembly protein TadD